MRNFPGTEQERKSLLKTLETNCQRVVDYKQCIMDRALHEDGPACAAHKILQDQRTLNRLVLGRHIKHYYQHEEWSD